MTRPHGLKLIDRPTGQTARLMLDDAVTGYTPIAPRDGGAPGESYVLAYLYDPAGNETIHAVATRDLVVVPA